MATPAAAKVIAEALALSDEERAAVAEELLASLDPTQSDDSPEAVAAFKAALDRRWAVYQSGDVAMARCAHARTAANRADRRARAWHVRC